MAHIRPMRDRRLFRVVHTSRLPPQTGTEHSDLEGGHFVDKEGHIGFELEKLGGIVMEG